MRLRIVRDGKTEEVEVAADRSSVTVAERTFPVVVVRSEPLRVELEVGGEKVVVEGWPEHFPDPPGPVDVNGERAPVEVVRRVPPSGSAAGPPSAPRGALMAAPPSASPATPSGTPIVPPMPGRVIEVRVSEGARVAAGSVLLVLEAMKMRNEVTAPVAGVARGLRVSVGATARAREPMLYIDPD